MKKFLLIANLFLLLAIAVLYYLYFSYVNADSHVKKQINAQVANSFKIAYFDLDTIENNYEYFKEVRTYLTNRQDSMNAQLNKLRNNYLGKVNEFNRSGPNLSQAQQSQFQEQLAKMENDYQEQQQALSQEMQATIMQKMQEKKNRLQDFLKGYCRDKGYAYVFASNDNDYIYYKDTIRNITSDILRALNEEHSTEKKK